MIDGSLKKLTPEGFRIIGREMLVSLHQDQAESGESVWQVPGQPSVTWNSYDMHPFTTPLPDGHGSLENELGQHVLTRNGKQYTFELSGDLQFILPGRDQDHAWTLSASYAASAGSYEFLTDVDWQSGKAKRVASGVLRISFDPDGRYFSALEGGRSLSKYGSRRRVWTKNAYIGELSIGSMWSIASGLVLGESTALRPSH